MFNIGVHDSPSQTNLSCANQLSHTHQILRKSLSRSLAVERGSDGGLSETNIAHGRTHHRPVDRLITIGRLKLRIVDAALTLTGTVNDNFFVVYSSTKHHFVMNCSKDYHRGCWRIFEVSK